MHLCDIVTLRRYEKRDVLIAFVLFDGESTRTMRTV